MKNTHRYLFKTMVITATAMMLPMASHGQGNELETKKNIEEIVIEARENAKMWAEKVRDYVGGEEQSTTYIGVVIESVPPVLRDYVDIPAGVGLLLPKIAKDGPAEKAGMQDNDILVKFDNQLIVNYSQFSTLLRMKKPGDTVPVVIIRKGDEIELDVTLEERVRKGMRFLSPDAPDAPPVPEVGSLMERIDEWMPGSVRVFIDENEQVHVDLDELKNDLEGMRSELKHIRVISGSDDENIVMKHGDEGARTTTIHIADKNLNYISDEGRVEVNSVGDQRYAKVWDENDTVLYEGPLSEDYALELPEKAVELIDALESIKLDTEEREIEVEMHAEHSEPVTMVIHSD